MRKSMLLLVLVIGMLAVQTRFVNAYGSQQTGTINGVNVTFSNNIDTGKKQGGASTQTTSQYAAATVQATFYWVDYGSQSFGTSYKHFESYGSASVVADVLTDDDMYYYKVSSYHTASYGGQTLITDHNLVTYAP